MIYDFKFNNELSICLVFRQVKPDKNDKTDKTDKTDKNVVKFINVLPDSPYARSFTLRGGERIFQKRAISRPFEAT